VTHQDLVLDALHRAIHSLGVVPHGIDQKCITEDQWRDAFYALMPDAEPGTKRQAFHRHKKRACEDGRGWNIGRVLTGLSS
jgi:hypothetical protein